MAKVTIQRQFGLWDSPISPASLARGIGVSGLAWDTGPNSSGSLIWLENRSDRGVLVVQPPDGQAPRELNSEFSVRAKVGYGGGDFTAGSGFVYFVDDASGRIYRQPLTSGLASPVTPAFGHNASPAISADGRWLLFVRSYEGQDTLEIVDSAGQMWPQKLASGADFYMQPTWHLNSCQVAWVEWNHPNMPWDGTHLQMGRLSFPAGSLPAMEQVETITGDGHTSIFQPEFSPDGRYLAYVSDASNWWQLYLYDLQSREHRQLTYSEAEHGWPAWVQGMRTYAFDTRGDRLYFLRNSLGSVSLWQYDLADSIESPVNLADEYLSLDQICIGPSGIGLVASGPRIPTRVITLQPDGSDRYPRVSIHRRATSEELPSAAYASPQTIQWTGLDGGTTHGLYYPPQNERFEGIGKPPLIITVHGGPTSQVRNGFNLRNQYFTSRGYAVLEVNHRGSTGYGRDYRNMLRGNWGIYDVQDSVSGARDLADKGAIDPGRVVIMGGSAGGFTVLKALEDFPGFFKAAICLFGVSNQFTLAAETHKFEAHYSDTLLGPLPEAAAIYRERSPIFFVDKIQDPIAVFQGEDDNVVPRKQSDDVVESLRRRGVPHIYHVYPGEGHGFRKSETIEHFYTAVDQFLRQYVIFA